MGVQLSIRPTDGWRITMNSEYDQFVWGNMTNYSATHIIDSLDRTSPSFGVILRHGYGLRGSLKIVKEGDFFNYFLEVKIAFLIFS